MRQFMRRCCCFMLGVFTLSCSSRSVDTELTRCVYPDSPRTPAPAFICGAEISGFPTVALRSAPASEIAMRERLQAQLEEQILIWAEQWALEWFDTPADIRTAKDELNRVLIEQARVVRSRTSPKDALWLLIGIPMTVAELEAEIRSLMAR